MSPRNPKSSPGSRRRSAASKPQVPVISLEPRAEAAGRVERTEVVQRCLAAPPGSIVLLEAPAGYGKTCAFAQWYAAVRREDRRAVWMTLRESERTVSALARVLSASMEHAGFARAAQIPIPADEVLAQHSRQHVEATVEAFTDIVRAFRRPVTLLLDGYESAESAATDAFLCILFEQLPGNLVVGIASRHLVQFSVSRWLLQGRLQRLDKRSLLFSKSDVRTLFGGSLSPTELHRLHALTEGWPAAVKFAQICLEDWRKQPVALEALPAFARLVGDFCLAEVLKDLDAEGTALLVEASAFETLEPDLCDAVRQRNDSGALIAQIAARQTFLDPVESAINSWRVPRILRQTLLSRALAYGPASLMTIHLRAAEQYEARGAILEAVRHYVAAGAAHKAALAFERVSPMGVAARQGDERGAAILDLIPAQCLSQYPRVALCRVYLDYKRGFMEEARHLLERISERTNEFTVDRDGGDSARLHVEALVCMLEMDIYGISKVTTPYLQSIEERISQISRADPRLGDFAHCMGGIVCSIRGELDAARAHFIQCEKLAAQDPHAWMELWLKYHRGSLALAHGQMMEAKYHLQAGMKQWRKEFSGYKTFGAAATVLLAEIDYENDALDEAQAKLEEAIYTVENTEGWYEHYTAVYEIATMTLLHSGRSTEAQALIGRAGATKRVSHVLNGFLEILRLRLSTLQGMKADPRVAEALERLRERWMHADSHEEFSGRAWDLAGICLCRAALQADRLRQAAEVLDNLEREVRRQRRNRTLVKALVLRAAILHRTGELAPATTQMIEALEIGGAQGYRRAFLDEGIAIRPVLELVVNGAPVPVPARLGTIAHRLLDALNAHMQEATPGSPRLLSEREADVMHELNLGRSNKAIGRKLTLCESTVKFHIKNIFRKLGVRRRGAAVLEAKRRGLVH